MANKTQDTARLPCPVFFRKVRQSEVRTGSSPGFIGNVAAGIFHGLFLHAVHENGRADAEHAQGDQHPAEGRGEQDGRAAAGQPQGAAQAVFADGAPGSGPARWPPGSDRTCGPDSPARRKIIMMTTSKKFLWMAKEPTTHRTATLGIRMASERREICAKPRQPRRPMPSIKNWTSTKAREKGIGHGRVAGKQLRPRLETLNDQSAHEHGGHGLAGDAQRQHGDQGAAGHGVVGRLRTCHALDGTFSRTPLCDGRTAGRYYSPRSRRWMHPRREEYRSGCR